MPIGSRTVIMAMRPVRTSASVNVTPSASPFAARATHAPAKQSACCSVVIVGSATLEIAGAGLDGVAELVGQDDAEDRRPELLGQPVEHALLAVVVDHEVALLAVEGRVLTDLLVRRLLAGAASRDRIGALGIGGVHASRRAARNGLPYSSGYCSDHQRWMSARAAARNPS